MNTISALQRLKESLQSAATMCGPTLLLTKQLYDEEEFESADLEEEDCDQCVGVDPRAEDLEAESFLDSDDVDWHSGALWLFSKGDTINFLSRALFAHLSPLYMTYSPLSAKIPEDIIPDDVKSDVKDLLVRFVDDTFEKMSVQDVKDSLSSGKTTLVFSCCVNLSVTKVIVGTTQYS